ncbi:MAG: N-acetylglucosamine-6-phosphate deacetylase [Eubacterium sp.]|nr:N-acetylglucosamine-6-phosphate deacetylase [Eubacterium sp.]
MIFKNCTFWGEDFEKEFGDIEIENGKIKQIGILGEGRDMSGMLLVPGFVDIHIHGFLGGDASDGDKKAIETMSRALSHYGVTSFCPTTMTLSREGLEKAVKAISECEAPKAKIAGINLEGPFISKEKAGSQKSENIRAGSVEEFEKLYSISGGKIKLITIAPESFESDEFIKTVSKKCTVSIGHSNADEKACKRAIEFGARHITHLYNAMTPMHHRNAGIVGTALDDGRVMCELICDLEHICPAVLRNTFRILSQDRAVVVSDSMRGAGLGEGEYDLGGQKVFVNNGRKYAALSDGTLAASITNIHEEFVNLVNIGIDFKTALKACTINPARAIGEEKSIGSIAIGKCADLVFLNENLDIKEVYINGILA